MTKKRGFSLLIAVMLLLSSVLPVYAGTAAADSSVEQNAKISKEEAKKAATDAVKKFFGLEIDDKKYQTNIQLMPRMDFRRSYSWEVSWSLFDGRTSSHISAGIDAATGKLTRFYKSESYSSRDQVAVALLSKEQAQGFAETFLAKTNPEQFKQTKLLDMNSAYYVKTRPDYSFRYIREINGIRYDNNYINVSINGVDGSIRSYDYNWEEDINFPSAEGVISKEKAMQILKDSLDMKLRYSSVRSKIRPSTEPPVIRLAYQPDYQYGIYADALTGQALDYSGKPLAEQKSRDISREQMEKYAADTKTRRVISKEIDSKRAAEIINHRIKEFFGENYRLENLNYSENEVQWQASSKRTWSAEIIKNEDASVNFVGQVSIDALTEELLSFNRYDNGYAYGEAYEPKLTWEQAYDKAIELIGSYFPGKLPCIKTKQTNYLQTYLVNNVEVPERRVYFHFPRVEKGIEFTDSSIAVDLDLKTGEVMSLYCNWIENPPLPSAEGNIGGEKAKELYLKDFDAVLKYVPINQNKAPDSANPLKIVYSLENKPGTLRGEYIDALSGKITDYSGEEINMTETDFNTKIKGLPAEKELSILAFQGIIDAKDFDPDREITFIELVKMLVNAKGYRPTASGAAEVLLFKNITKKDDSYSYINEAVRYGLLENEPVELELEAKVTREQMVELIVTMSNYDKLAQAKDIFVLSFEDAKQISPDRTGYVAIGKGLGIITADNGKFRPNDDAKMAEAAVGIYKALDSLR